MKPAAAPSGFAFIVGTSGATSAAAATTSAIDTTGANLIVVGATGSSAFTVTDSKGNTWTALTETGIGIDSQLYYCLNPTVGSGHTFTNTASYPTVHVVAVSGAAASSVFDVESVSSTGSPGSVTPSVNGSLLVTVEVNDSSADFASAISGGFTMLTGQPFTGGQNYGGRMAYLIQTTAAAISPTWTFAGGISSTIASFKPA